MSGNGRIIDRNQATQKRQTPECFLKVKFQFLAHYIFFSILHFPVMIHTVVSHSTFKPPHHCVGPQNIHLLRLHHLYHFLLFYFFFNTTNRPLGRQCKSRNSVKLLRNAVVGFGNVIFSFCCSDLLPFYRVYVFSFLYLPPPLFSFFCLYCLSFIGSTHIAPLT